MRTRRAVAVAGDGGVLRRLRQLRVLGALPLRARHALEWRDGNAYYARTDTDTAAEFLSQFATLP